MALIILKIHRSIADVLWEGLAIALKFHEGFMIVRWSGGRWAGSWCVCGWDMGIDLPLRFFGLGQGCGVAGGLDELADVDAFDLAAADCFQHPSVLVARAGEIFIGHQNIAA